jgi:hypothetical protein
VDEVNPFPFNRDWQRRDAILQPFTRTDGPFAGFDTGGDIFFFQGVRAEAVAQLLAEGYLDPDERQNDSPSASEFFAFMQRHPEVLAHGYATSIEREDYRVTIEGVSYRGPVSEQLRREVVQLFGSADECRVEPNGMYVWYD